MINIVETILGSRKRCMCFPAKTLSFNYYKKSYCRKYDYHL